MSFKKDLGRFRIKATKVTSEVYRSSLFDVFTAIVLGTPVDTGVLRNSWFIGISSPDFIEGGRAGEKQGQDSLNSLRAVIQDVNIGSTVFYTNPMSYGPTIEYDGHSRKAPEGMVRVNLMKWNQIVQANAKRLAK